MEENKEKYINPLTDFGFKKLFGTEPNKVLLIDFLNQILPDQKIKDLTYSSGEKQGLTELDRKAIFDLYCVGDNGERFIVEMQKAKQKYFKDRSVFYTSFLIQEQSKKNKWDYKLEPVYSVAILDFIFDDHKDEEELLHIVELKDQRNEVFYEKLKFVYVELPKFKKKEEDLKTHFDKWMYVFTHLSELQDRPKKLQDRIFNKLFEAAEIAKFSPKEREAYEESLRYYRDIQNVVDTSKEEGRKEGKEEGLKEGLKEGEITGLKKGKEEKRDEIARKLKAGGVSVEMIMQSTGLSREEIEKL
ncbi:MAG: putative transposase/invertase (TIGR01784 family) [Saprospiraceae bacterium]|jgi:predicted transposase/invertase (TIGR01784 family)